MSFVLGGRRKCGPKTFLLYTNGWPPCLNPFLGLAIFYFANVIPPLPAFSLRNREHWVQMPLTYFPLSSVWGPIPNTFLLFSKEKGLFPPPKDRYLAHSAPPPPWNTPVPSGTCHIAFSWSSCLLLCSPFHVTFSIILLGCSLPALNFHRCNKPMIPAHTAPQRVRLFYLPLPAVIFVEMYHGQLTLKYLHPPPL